MGLFLNKYRNVTQLGDFHTISASYTEWYKEIRQRRDPVAHRIPLSVPPAFQDDETIIEYQDVQQKHATALQNFFAVVSTSSAQAEIDAAQAEIDRLYSKLQTIGKFAPFIVHDPNDDMVRIYPTVAEDIGTFVHLGRDINRHPPGSQAEGLFFIFLTPAASRSASCRTPVRTRARKAAELENPVRAAMSAIGSPVSSTSRRAALRRRRR